MKPMKVAGALATFVLASALVGFSGTASAAEADPGENCDAGGPGSPSCSVDYGITGCSVTCASPYYACCREDLFIAQCFCQK